MRAPAVGGVYNRVYARDSDNLMRRILITAALPYANGDIHLGHLVEYIQADIWARFQKMRGHECWFVCADDSHGTPIMLRAEAEGVTPEQLIDGMRVAHERDFAAFGVAFDQYHSTHSKENQALSEEIYAALRARGCIVERTIEQLYDPLKGMFLPDRYVRGECPSCGAADQYGDSCEACGSAYSATELKNPVSALSGAVPEMRPSLHYFLRLAGEEEALRAWVTAEIADPAGGGGTVPRLQREAVNKLGEWLEGGLRDWDVSRDPPYFGFRIPDAPDEKYFYVWLDAPIGYMASFRHLCTRRGDVAFEDFWRVEAEKAGETELYHFIGKDILYFHGLFWPMMLANSGYRRPTRLFAHGFLTVNGEKMSKSRGTFITARRYLETGLRPDALRYYYACKLGDRIQDIDLNLADFAARVNSDLVHKLVNIASRCAGFLHRFFDGKLDGAADLNYGAGGGGEEAVLPGRLAALREFDGRRHAFVASRVAAAYEKRYFYAIVAENEEGSVMNAVRQMNVAIEAAMPWAWAGCLKKKDGGEVDEARVREGLHEICSQGVRWFHLFVGYLAPIVPDLAEEARQFLDAPAYSWRADGIAPLPAGHRIGAYRHLMRRMEKKDIAALIAAPVAPAEEGGKGDAAGGDAEAGEVVGIAEFARMDIRVAVVAAAEAVEGSDKLVRLQVDAGEGRLRQVFAGIRAHYAPEDLVGRRVLFLANLAPRKMRFGVSEGMVLAAGDGERLALVQPDIAVAAGAKVR